MNGIVCLSRARGMVHGSRRANYVWAFVLDSARSQSYSFRPLHFDVMSSELTPEISLQIGHVLFIDIVGYSKLLITEQTEQIQKLTEIVRSTEQFRLAEREGKLLSLPTGDGAALVFRTSPEAPVLCALEISNELKKHPQLRVLMGIHSGPVNEIVDINGQANIAGAGINIAQRIMDCADAGHILLSKHVAEDLERSRQPCFLANDAIWASRLIADAPAELPVAT